jgi:hypothetical protein
VLIEEGVLILEYPLYHSYHKRRNTHVVYNDNLKNSINIDPMTFPTFLSHLGFHQLQPDAIDQSSLKHPIALFRKKSVEAMDQE